MTLLFAALDTVGAMRFIGEVARGAACGCLCPECGSPLVAKQGHERDWHFAHEAGQERPECLPGATNMLRRLVVEYLQALPTLELPRYSRWVRVASPYGPLGEEVSWGAQLVGVPTWFEGAPHAAAVARGRLDNGVEVEIFLDFSESLPSFLPSAAGATASVVFWCTVPVTSDLRRRVTANQHIARHGRFVWRHQPDMFGLVEAATKRLAEQVDRATQAERLAHARQAEEAGRRWAAASRQLHQAQHRQVAEGLDSRGEPAHAGSGPAAAPGSAPPPVQTYPWAPGRKPGCSFLFYRLHDGAAWVVYTMSDDTTAIAPWPAASDGWEHLIPDFVGVPDIAMGIYRATGLTQAIMYFRDKAAITRASSSPAEFAGL